MPAPSIIDSYFFHNVSYQVNQRPEMRNRINNKDEENTGLN